MKNFNMIFHTHITIKVIIYLSHKPLQTYLALDTLLITKASQRY